MLLSFSSCGVRVSHRCMLLGADDGHPGTIVMGDACIVLQTLKATQVANVCRTALSLSITFMPYESSEWDNLYPLRVV